ncbi:unnamed protein product [Linum trigynum]|uniref:Uncharacterized protein n=1 Tax=Linum trigynum TaxID=586398 RepID=A0AAV2EST2_9ROSI
MDNLREYNEDASKWLLEKPLSQWCRAYFLPHCKRPHRNEQGSQQSTAGNEQPETTYEHFQAGNEVNAADLWYSGDNTRRSNTRYANLAGLAARVLYPHQTSEAGTSNHQSSTPVHVGATCQG